MRQSTRSTTTKRCDECYTKAEVEAALDSLFNDIEVGASWRWSVETRADLVNALNRLPERDRLVLALRGAGWTAREVSRRLAGHPSFMRVTGHYRRALNHLEREMNSWPDGSRHVSDAEAVARLLAAIARLRDVAEAANDEITEVDDVDDRPR